MRKKKKKTIEEKPKKVKPLDKKKLRRLAKKLREFDRKKIEERIEAILLNMYFAGEEKPDVHLEMNVKKLKSLLSDIIREIVGKDWESEVEEDVIPNYSKTFYAGYNQAKQEIREKARKLGLNV